MRRLRIVTASLALALLAAPVAAAPPQRSAEPLFFIFLNEELGAVEFFNIDRDEFCAWEAGGFVGDAPVETLVPEQSVATGKGALVVRNVVTSTYDIWLLDDDADLSGPCQDTDDQDGPWATGFARVMSNDNDLDVSGTRTNSFGDRGQGTVREVATGQGWALSWTFRATIDRHGTFYVRADHRSFRAI